MRNSCIPIMDRFIDDCSDKVIIASEKKKKKKKKKKKVHPQSSTHSLVSREDMISIRWETSRETQSSPHTILCTGVLQLTTEEQFFFSERKVTGVGFEHRVLSLSTNT